MTPISDIVDDALREGDAARAIREFESTIELRPNDAMAHYYLALAVLRTWRNEQQPAQLERGLTELRRALELKPVAVWVGEQAPPRWEHCLSASQLRERAL